MSRKHEKRSGLVARAAAAVTAAALGASAGAAPVLVDDFETASHPAGDRSVATGLARPVFSRFDTTTATTVGIVADASLGSNALSVNDKDNSTSTSGLVIIPLASAITLSTVGDAATLSFRFRYTNQGSSATNGFRFGLESSNGSAVTADNAPESDNDSGYYVGLGAVGSAPSTTGLFWRETGLTNPALGGTDRGSPSLTASDVTGAAINDTAVHTVRLALTRTAAGVQLALTIDNAATPLTTTDTTSPPTSFDEILFSGGFGSTGQAWRLDDLTLDYAPVSPAPEPATAGLLVLGALLPLARRRRHG